MRSEKDQSGSALWAQSKAVGKQQYQCGAPFDGFRKKPFCICPFGFAADAFAAANSVPETPDIVQGGAALRYHVLHFQLR